MDGFTIFVNFLLIVIFIALNGFFVSAEFTIVKVRLSQLEELIAKGDKRAEYAKQLADQMDVSLSVTQLGITLASLALGWIGEPFLAELLRAPLAAVGVTGAAVDTVAFAVAFSFITAAHIILGELVPKNISIVRPLDMLLVEALPLLLFQRLTYPFVWFLNHVANGIIHRFMGIDVAEEEDDAHSEAEIRLLMEESRKKGYIDKTEYDFVDNVFDFSDKAVRDIMIPRADMVCLYLERSIQENVDLAIREQMTRYPICREDKDHIIGFLHIKDLMEPLRRGKMPNLRLMARQAFIVPETMAVSRLLKTLQKNRAQLAIVVDEYGGTAGMVTVEDIVEEIVGDIQDEFDNEQDDILSVGDGMWRWDARVNLDDLNEKIGSNFPNTEFDTLGGFVFDLYGKIPSKFEKREWNNYEFVVQDMNGHRINQIKIIKREEESE